MVGSVSFIVLFSFKKKVTHSFRVNTNNLTFIYIIDETKFLHFFFLVPLRAESTDHHEKTIFA